MIPRKQQGMSLVGFLIVLAMVVFFAYLGMRITPIYLEFYSVKSAMEGLARESGSANYSPFDIKDKFINRLYVSYSDGNVGAEDIKIVRNNGVWLQVKYELAKTGCSDDEIAEIFRRHPIGSKLRENGPSYLRLTISKAREWSEAESSAEISEVRLDRRIYLENAVPGPGKGPGKRVRLNGTDCDSGMIWSHALSWPDHYRGTEDHVRALFASAGLTISAFSDPATVFQLSNRTIRVAEFWPPDCREIQTRFLPAIAPAELPKGRA